MTKFYVCWFEEKQRKYISQDKNRINMLVIGLSSVSDFGVLPLFVGYYYSDTELDFDEIKNVVLKEIYTIMSP